MCMDFNHSVAFKNRNKVPQLQEFSCVLPCRILETHTLFSLSVAGPVWPGLKSRGAERRHRAPLGLVADIPNIQQHGLFQQGTGELLLTPRRLCS